MSTFDDLTDPFLPSGFREIFENATGKMVTEIRIKAVLVAYDAALQDKKAVIPTALHVAIEGLRRV